jgi:hypothetical protein
MLAWNQYPATRPGDRIIWAPEPNSNPLLWLVGIVILQKNQSCDLRVYCPDGREVTKHDCWHADDPNCKLTPGTYREPGRGVFRLAPSELESRDLRERIIPMLRREVAQVRAENNQLRARVDALLAEGDSEAGARQRGRLPRRETQAAEAQS